MFSLKKKRLNGALIAAFSNLSGGYKEDGSRLFSGVHSESITGNAGNAYST